MIALMLFGLLVTAGAWGDTAAHGKSLCEVHPSECDWHAGEVGGAPAPQPSQAPKPVAGRKNKGASPPQVSGPRNLPEYLLTGGRSVPEEQSGVVIAVEKPIGALLPGLRPGDLLQASLEQSIKASPGVPTPVRARVTVGRFKNVICMGSATLDAELKRILLTFDRLRLPHSDAVFAMKAAGLAPSGQVGLEGQHHTDEGLFLGAELAAATAGGFADATVTRSQTVTGTYQTEPSLANAGKLGAVQALSKTADRFAERTRNAPEYTEIEADRDIQILIQESPTEAGGGL